MVAGTRKGTRPHPQVSPPKIAGGARARGLCSEDMNISPPLSPESPTESHSLYGSAHGGPHAPRSFVQTPAATQGTEKGK